MRLGRGHVGIFLLIWTWMVSLPYAVLAQNATQWPLQNNEYTDIVQWDHYSFIVNEKRLFVFSGELHYWRIPVPELWEDILEKIKACGFTAVAFYTHWGYHSHSPDALDFETGGRNFTHLFEIAKRVGLYVIERPGPYVNAESNAGGFPGWLTTGEYGKLRNSDPRYGDAYAPFWQEVARLSAPYQITEGGNTILYQIENEYQSQWIGNPVDRVPNQDGIAYMEDLEKRARDNGIIIPTIQNAPNMNTKSWSKDWSDEGGNVDVYGLDSYPSCWSCNLDECTSTNGQYVAYSVANYYGHFQDVSPTQPSFMPEFQGGSYNPWGGPEGGCPNDIGSDFANLFYRQLIGERVTAVSLYMMYGGTNWGALAAPVVATSYDYSAPISENRAIWDKFSETKTLALFTRVADDLTVTERLGNGTFYTTNSLVMATELRNSETNGAFYVTRHSPSYLASRDAFKLHVSTSVGNLTIPQGNSSIVINGHQSKIIVTDFRFGSHSFIYSTAEVLTYAVFDNIPTIALWVPTGESGEFYVRGGRHGHIARAQNATVAFRPAKHGLIVEFTQGEGASVIFVDDMRVLLLDRTAAYGLWAPSFSTDPASPVDETILVLGPYLVRGASLTSDTTFDLTGDIPHTTSIEVFAPAKLRSLTWNGVQARTRRTSYGTLIADIQFTPLSPELPDLSGAVWRVADALPEIKPEYVADTPAWRVADQLNPQTGEAVLYADLYGFHYGAMLFRGTFLGGATGVELAVQGGTAFGWSAWLNGGFVGSWTGDADSAQGNLTLSFVDASATVFGDGKENVLLVIMDNTGHDQRDGALNPRGILAANLLSASNNTTSSPGFTEWKIAGGASLNGTPLDPVRGIMNENGLTPSRLGWSLPGFDSTAWPLSTPSTLVTSPGVRFYRTTFPLSIPAGYDASLSIVLDRLTSSALRAEIYVNGYNYGKYVPGIGGDGRGQSVFPVPPGVWDYDGENVLGLSVWGMEDGDVGVGVKLQVDWVVEGGVMVKGEGLRPGWTEAREAFM
ncbi:hypothetical protein EJ05DRAFT_505133 [Pseudovirgaria hyperparasitica]|uniref:beta-galactosidase n=1 Tax=Pseudovirgaria hyperparasitica TaxID=470096 RepID=A0A6A6VW82_9PEZI|nr:uncharacterized protein EJ05DRAFT_505133 [Pseudovirgaria hyperparasitica]KAF2753501.1 hypothetical protein EJ05DRAFT_505133 [Pseudovirgaria hyperparasitica]